MAVVHYSRGKWEMAVVHYSRGKWKMAVVRSIVGESGKWPWVFLLLVVKLMSYRSSNFNLSASQCMRIVVLLASSRLDYYDIPNSVVLTQG